jgi:hypothetical protein
VRFALQFFLALTYDVMLGSVFAIVGISLAVVSLPEFPLFLCQT